MLRIFFSAIWILIYRGSLTIIWILKGIFRVLRFFLRPAPSSHGTARWARLGDLTRGRALGGDTGLIVGKKYGQFIRFKREGAVIVSAPMGRGKGVGIVIPNLLDHRGSALVTDPKGENYAVTRRHRSTIGDVFALNAINPEQSDCFNPLSMVRVGTYHETEDLAQIADFLVIPEGRDGHWDTSAKNFVTAVLQHVLHSRHPELQTLAEARSIVAGGKQRLEAELELMAMSTVPSVAEEARLILSMAQTDVTLAIMQNAGKALAFWSRDRVGGRLTATSHFSMLDLNTAPITIYVMVPDDKIEIYAPFLRMMAGCAVAALMRGKDQPRPEHKPLLMIDECRALGKLEALEKGMGMLREYCRVVTIWQDQGQLRKLYGEDGVQSFVSASGAQVSFGISDHRTARNLADDIGQATVWSHSTGSSERSFNLMTASWQDGRSETGRFLKDSAELRKLDEDQCVILMQAQVRQPILAKKVRFFEEGCWRGRWDRWRAPLVDFPPRDPPSSPGSHQRSEAA